MNGNGNPNMNHMVPSTPHLLPGWTSFLQELSFEEIVWDPKEDFRGAGESSV